MNIQDVESLIQVTINHLHSLMWSKRRIRDWFEIYHFTMMDYIEEIHSYIPPKGIVLEVGCGGGYLSYLMKFSGFNVITGDIVDTDTPAGNFWIFSRKLRKRPTFIRFDGRSLPFKKKYFDVVVANAVLEHVGWGEEKFLRDISRVLKTGGSLFIYGLPKVLSYEYFGRKLGLGTAHERFYSEEYVSKMLEKEGLNILLIERYWFLPILLSKLMPSRIFHCLRKQLYLLRPFASYLKIICINTKRDVRRQEGLAS